MLVIKLNIYKPKIIMFNFLYPDISSTKMKSAASVFKVLNSIEILG